MACSKAVQAAALVAAVFLSLPVRSQSTSADDKSAADKAPETVDLAARGRQIYTSKCSHCHGINMASTGSGFFDLRTFPADDKPRFVSSVTNGKRAMPAWGAILKPEDIEFLWAYVMTAKK
jgi:cytochrome c55X